MAMTLNELQSQLTGLDQYQKTDEATLRGRAESIYRPQYEQDILSLKDSLNTQLAQQGRSALANGMQRSSYNQAAAASIRGSGLRAQGELAANYEGNVAAALQNMLDKEQDRADAADANRNNLLLQLYQLGQAGKGSGGTGGTNGTTVNGKPTDVTDNTAGIDALMKSMFGTTPNKVTSITQNYTDQERAAYNATSASQRNAARKGTTSAAKSPEFTSYNARVDYNPYSYQYLQDALKNK